MIEKNFHQYIGKYKKDSKGNEKFQEIDKYKLQLDRFHNLVDEIWNLLNYLRKSDVGLFEQKKEFNFNQEQEIPSEEEQIVQQNEDYFKVLWEIFQAESIKIYNLINEKNSGIRKKEQYLKTEILLGGLISFKINIKKILEPQKQIMHTKLKFTGIPKSQYIPMLIKNYFERKESLTLFQTLCSTCSSIGVGSGIKGLIRQWKILTKTMDDPSGKNIKEKFSKDAINECGEFLNQVAYVQEYTKFHPSTPTPGYNLRKLVKALDSIPEIRKMKHAIHKKDSLNQIFSVSNINSFGEMILAERAFYCTKKSKKSAKKGGSNFLKDGALRTLFSDFYLKDKDFLEKVPVYENIHKMMDEFEDYDKNFQKKQDNGADDIELNSELQSVKKWYNEWLRASPLIYAKSWIVHVRAAIDNILWHIKRNKKAPMWKLKNVMREAFECGDPEIIKELKPYMKLDIEKLTIIKNHTKSPSDGVYDERDWQKFVEAFLEYQKKSEKKGKKNLVKNKKDFKGD